jgi:hypothetical protein
MGSTGLAPRAVLLAVCVLAASLVAAPAASARRVDRDSGWAVLPRADPFGKLRRGERIVRLSVRTAPDASLEALLETFCFDRNLRLHRRRRTLTGTGSLRGVVRRPPGRYRDCSASASVRVTSRPVPGSGEVPPIRLGAALYARR